MSFFIQPILNLDELEQSRKVSRKDLADYEKQEASFIELLKVKIPQIEFRKTAQDFPENVTPGQYLLWFIGSYSDERIIELALSLNDEVKHHTILFGYAGEDPKELLEATHFAGLVTEATVHYWKADLPETAFKLGIGHGLYGLKSFFNEEEFSPLFKSIKSSENYMIFYNYTDYQLDRILFKYINILYETSIN